MTLDPTLVTVVTSAATLFGKGILGLAAKDAWEKVKDFFGAKGEKNVEGAIGELEKEPDSEGRKIVLAEKLGASSLGQSPDLAELIKELKAALEADSNPSVQETLRIVGNTISNTGSGAVAVGKGNIVGGAGSTIDTGGAGE